MKYLSNDDVYRVLVSIPLKYILETQLAPTYQV
jgi:hypothetical protein